MVEASLLTSTSRTTQQNKSNITTTKTDKYYLLYLLPSTTSTKVLLTLAPTSLRYAACQRSPNLILL